MFVININYLKPVEEIDKALTAHREFLAQYYNEEIFLCSGGKVPRTGGIILACKVSRERLQEIIREDPFYKQELAEYTIIEFSATRCLDKFKEFTD